MDAENLSGNHGECLSRAGMARIADSFRICSKKAVSAGLLLFVAVSVVALVLKNVGPSEEATGIDTPQDGVVVAFFHRNERCDSCRTIEACAREAIETRFADELADGTISWHVVAYEQAGNEQYVERYNLVTSTVVVSRYDDGTETSWQNLMEAWELKDDKTALVDFVAERTSAALDGQETPNEHVRKEIKRYLEAPAPKKPAAPADAD